MNTLGGFFVMKNDSAKEKQTNDIIDNTYQSFIPVPAGILIARMVDMFDSWVCLGCVFGESWMCLG